jgi:two-component system chemotaxis sensor kinase CheA
MDTDPQVEQIFTAIEQLRELADDGPRTRRLLDELFRSVHNLKANASANGLNSLAGAAHEFETVLHSLRTAEPGIDGEVAIPADVWNSLKQQQKHAVRQSLAEGAKLFLIQTDFDVADFDRQFKSLKEALIKNGEVISTSPSLDNERPGRVNFKILYARTAESSQTLLELSDIFAITVAEIPLPVSPVPATSGFQHQTQTLGRSFEKLSAELVNLRMVSIGNPLERALRAGQSAARATSKEVEFEVSGNDQSLPEVLANPLLHLVRNAVDHGIETSDERIGVGKPSRGKIVIEITRSGDQTIVTVTDDGRGIDPAVVPLIFQPGFSTAAEVSELSGRGVGLDVVKTILENAGGSVSVSSEPGKGSTFTVRLNPH